MMNPKCRPCGIPDVMNERKLHSVNITWYKRSESKLSEKILFKGYNTNDNPGQIA